MPGQLPPPYIPSTAGGWWSRNIRWAVPVLVLGTGLFLLAGIGVFAWGVMAAMKSSGAYRQAVAIARADPALVQALGSPIEEAWYFTGSIQTHNGDGQAELLIPLSGPRGSARLRAEGRGRDGDWVFDVLRARLDADGRVIELQSAQAPPGGEAPRRQDGQRKSGNNRKGGQAGK